MTPEFRQTIENKWFELIKDNRTILNQEDKDSKLIKQELVINQMRLECLRKFQER